MTAEKARVFSDEEAFSKILATSNPKDIKALVREVKNFDAKKWSAVSKDIVVKGHLHKFAHDMDLFKFLHDTGNKVLLKPVHKIQSGESECKSRKQVLQILTTGKVSTNWDLPSWKYVMI